MSLIDITAGGYSFKAIFEEANAPKTCAKFRSLLPYPGTHHSCPLERRRVLDSAGRSRSRFAVRKSHQLPGPRPAFAIPRRDFGNRNFAGLWRRPVREQNGTAGRKPFLDRCGRQRKSGGPGQDGVVAGRPRHRIQELLTSKSKHSTGHKPLQKIAGVRIPKRNRLYIPL